MRLTSGTKVKNIKLPSLDNTIFDSDNLIRKPYLLSFLRFASCPFCNLRIHELVSKFNEFGNDFTIVAVFDSSIENLQRHAVEHKSPFPILADEENKYYMMYGVEHSISEILKGMILKMPTLLKGMLNGYLPLTIKGSLTTMPVDILVDQNDMIQRAYYGKDEGDHLPFDTVKNFSLKYYCRHILVRHFGIVYFLQQHKVGRTIKKYFTEGN